MNNGKTTERIPIRSVIIQVITKSDIHIRKGPICLITSMIQTKLDGKKFYNCDKICDILVFLKN